MKKNLISNVNLSLHLKGVTFILFLTCFVSWKYPTQAPVVIYYSNPFAGTLERTDGHSITVLAKPGGFPSGLAMGLDHSLYLGSQMLKTLCRYTAKGEVMGKAFGTGHTYTGMAIGPDNKLYAAENDGTSANGQVERYQVPTEIANGTLLADSNLAAYTKVHASSYFEGLAFGPDGNLYCASKHSNSILVYQGPKGKKPGALIKEMAGADQASGLAFGPDGKLYVSGFSNNTIARFNGKTFETFITGSNLKGPMGIAFGKDGYIYVANTGFGRDGNIARFQGPNGTSPGKFVDIFASMLSGGPVYLVIADK
ncbi:MAG: hypothetical protein M3N14_12230 [Bacteroidota bacterium]|nr:hypothetical protein [Bacteroidota bacterium]